MHSASEESLQQHPEPYRCPARTRPTVRLGWTMSRHASASAHRAAAVPIRFWAALARAPSAAGAHAVPDRKTGRSVGAQPPPVGWRRTR